MDKIINELDARITEVWHEVIAVSTLLDESSSDNIELATRTGVVHILQDIQKKLWGDEQNDMKGAISRLEREAKGVVESSKQEEILERAIYGITAISEALMNPGHADNDLNYTVSGLEGFGKILDGIGDSLRELRD